MSYKPSRLVALQYRDFRLLWFGQAVSAIGSQMQMIAVNWHIYSLLREDVQVVEILGRTFELDSGALGLGTLGLVRVFPIMLFALLGGVLADIVERRKLLLWADTLSAVFALILAVITFTGHVTVPLIYILSAALSAVNTLGVPARQSIVPNLVPKHHMANAVSLNTLIFQIGNIVGPAIGGVLVGWFNRIEILYALNAISYGATIVALILMRHRSKAASADGRLDWATAVEGLKFMYNTPILWGTVLLDFFATLFSSARTMLPIVADQILGVGPTGYGILATAQPVGALLTGIILSLRRDIQRQGYALLGGVIVYGLATALFGVSTFFTFSYVLFALTGAGDTISTVIRGTLRQVITPDHLRGRATSVSMIFFMGGPQLGELEAGLAAAFFGVPFAIFTGGVATVLLTLWVGWRYPQIRNYTGEKEYEKVFG